MTISLSGQRLVNKSLIDRNCRQILCWQFVTERFSLSPQQGPFTILATDVQPTDNGWLELWVCNCNYGFWDQYGWLDLKQQENALLPPTIFLAMYPAARDWVAKFFCGENEHCKYRKIWVKATGSQKEESLDNQN